jgi:hypothetical protein
MKAGEFELDMPAVMRVLNEQKAVAALEAAAARAVADAKASGPRGRSHAHQIDLIETHHTDSGALVDIDWPSHVWHIIEFGSVNNSPYRVITRAAQNQGLTITGGRR